MFNIRDLILVCVATAGLVFVLGCPGQPPVPDDTGEDDDTSGRCTPGVCDDDDPCTNDSCNVDTGECEHTDKCNDCDPCTSDECRNGYCYNTELDCDDGDLCTLDECIDGYCYNTELDCSDGDPCTADSCLGGGCLHHYVCGGEKAIDEQESVPCSPPPCGPIQGPLQTLVVSKWTKSEITYQLDFGANAAETTCVAELYEEAARAWSEHIPMNIRRARPGETIDIRVVLCKQNDLDHACDALTGEDGTRFAGEATFPNHDMPVTQLIALPDDLDNQIVQDVLLAVILHELGHNLGLLHSDVPDAIMYPVIALEDVAAGVELHADDITRIQDLYGDRAGTLDPVEPTLPVIPSDPDCVLPDPNGPDRDEDGLADTFEELVVRTDPDDPDTDGDGLLDGCEIQFGLDPNNPDGDEDGWPDRVEVIEGTPARTPVICHASDELAGDERAVFLEAAYFDELGFEEGAPVRISNLRNGCSANDITIRRAADPNCTVRMPRSIREELCIFQLSVAVPLRTCGMTAPVVLDDFEREISVLFTDDRGTQVDYVEREGSLLLQVLWSLDGFEDYKFVVVRVPQSHDVGPGQTLVADIWVDRPQVIEVGAKSSPPSTIAILPVATAILRRACSGLTICASKPLQKSSTTSNAESIPPLQ